MFIPPKHGNTIGFDPSPFDEQNYRFDQDLRSPGFQDFSRPIRADIGFFQMAELVRLIYPHRYPLVNVYITMENNHF
jgi:hypothetical protein